MLFSFGLILACASQEISGAQSVWLLEEHRPKILSIVQRSLPNLKIKSESQLNTSFIGSLDDILNFRYYPAEGVALLLCSSDQISEPVKVIVVNRQGVPTVLPRIPDWFFYGLYFERSRPVMVAYNYESQTWAEFIWLKSGWSSPNVIDVTKEDVKSPSLQFIGTARRLYSVAVNLKISIPSSQAGFTFEWDKLFDPYYSEASFSMNDQSFIVKEMFGKGQSFFLVGKDHRRVTKISLNLGSGLKNLTKFEGHFGFVSVDNRFWLFSDSGKFLASIPDVRQIADAF